MSDFTKVDPAAMSAGISALQRTESQFRDVLDRLRSDLTTSLQLWSGEARMAYQQQQHLWDQSAQRMSEVVGRMGQVLTQITTGYLDNERLIQSRWA